MELVQRQLQQKSEPIIPEYAVKSNNRSPFIEANTKPVDLPHLINDTILPVFSKDNEETISHAEFIRCTQKALKNVFPEYQQTMPDIRVSHIIKGRTPEAVGKPLKELLDREKTIYYERMAFIIELPEIQKNVNGNDLSLTVGGVRALNSENLHGKKTSEKFKVFIGFQNAVCTNLCVASDGFKNDLRAYDTKELEEKVTMLFSCYNQEKHLGNMERMSKFYLSSEQVAHLLGKMKMYQYLDKEKQHAAGSLNINDSQINTITKSYFQDKNFKVHPEGEINLWSLYNLFTGAVKSSYIDSFLQRESGAYEFTQELANSMQNQEPNYFLINN